MRRAWAGGTRLFARRSGAPAPPPAAPVLAGKPAEPDPPAVPAPAPATQDWAARLWGEGMALPGGSAEILRLAALLPLTPEATLLVAGTGARGAGALVSAARGCFAATFEAGPVPPPRQAGRPKVTSETLLPDAPAFRRAYHHHALLLEPFRAGATPDRFLAATAAALRPGGHMVLLDLVACDAAAGGMARWLAAEGRSQPPPGQHDLPAAMARAGFTIHVMEDVTARQHRAVIDGWNALTGAMRQRREHPGPADAAALVREAEAWLLRLRLTDTGACRLLRWHATVTRPAG